METMGTMCEHAVTEGNMMTETTHMLHHGCAAELVAVTMLQRVTLQFETAMSSYERVTLLLEIGMSRHKRVTLLLHGITMSGADRVPLSHVEAMVLAGMIHSPLWMLTLFAMSITVATMLGSLISFVFLVLTVSQCGLTECKCHNKH